MLYYINIFTISTLFTFMYLKTKVKFFKNIYLLISATLIILLSGLRYNVGTDFNIYIDMWYRFKDLSFFEVLSQSFEIINYIIIKISTFINSDNPQIFIFIYSILTVIFVYKAIIAKDKKMLPYYLITYLTLFFSFSLNGIRQGLAIAIILYAFVNFENGNKKNFIIFTLIASLVHNTALIVLPLIFYNGNNKRLIKIFAFYVIICLIIIFSGYYMNLIPQFSKYETYFTNYESSNLGFGVLVKKLPLIFIYLISLKTLSKKDKNTNLYFFMLLVDLMLAYLGYYSYYLSRLSLYFSIIMVFAIPNLLNITIGSLKLIVLCLILIVLYSIFIYQAYYLNINDILPYNSILDLNYR